MQFTASIASLVLLCLPAALTAPLNDNVDLQGLTFGGAAGAVEPVPDFDDEKFWGRRPKPGPRSEAHITTTKMVGAGHGTPFDDGTHVNAASGHQRIANIGMGNCDKGDHVSWLSFGFGQTPHDHLYDTVAHGKYDVNRLSTSFFLTSDEYFTKVEMTTHQVDVGLGDHHTRLSWIRFTTNQGRKVECGNHSFTDYIEHFDYDGQALLYMSGSAGDAIDGLVGHFVPISDI